MTPEALAQRMRQVAERVRRSPQASVRAVGLTVLQAVTTATPVDTGRARANWQVGLGSAPTDELHRVPHGTRKDPIRPNPAIREQVDWASAMSDGFSAIGGYTGGELHITNNVPYIVRLNEGWSPKAPGGFVEAAVEAGRAKVKALKATE